METPFAGVFPLSPLSKRRRRYPEGRLDNGLIERGGNYSIGVDLDQVFDGVVIAG